MAITQVNYTGDGVTVLYSITFEYLKRSHIKTTVNGLVESNFTFANDTTIQFNAAPPNGSSIVIFRETSQDGPENVFFPNSSITAEALNNNAKQVLFVVQEQTARILNKLGDTMQGVLNMGGFKITNLGAPVASTDAATRQYVDTTVSAGIPDGDKGDITVSSSGTVFTIDNSAVTSAKIADGTIVDVDVNASAAIGASKLAFTQAGSGAVQRTVDGKLKDVLSVKDFGAVGDGVTDDRAAIVNALVAANGRTVVLEGGKTYLISSKLAFTGTDINITSSGGSAVVFLNGQTDDGFEASGTTVRTTTLSDPTAKYSRTWTLADASGVQPGMLIEFKSDQLWYYDPRGTTKKSELHLIESVSGNDIRTYLPANDGYNTATETVTVTVYSPIQVNIEGIHFKAVKQLNPSSQKVAVTIRNALNPKITNLTTEQFQAVGLRLNGCYGSVIDKHFGIDHNFWSTGYGANIVGCTDTVFRNCHYKGCRRGIDITGVEVISLHALIEGCINDGGGSTSQGDLWGRQDSGVVTGTKPNYGFGSHGPADHITYRGNRMNTYFGINTRGGNEIIENNEFYAHVNDCITLTYGANRIIRNNSSLPGLTNKDLTRYDGGTSIFNSIPDHLITVSDSYDGGDFIEVFGNSGNFGIAFIEFRSGAVVPTSGFVVKDNNVKFLVNNVTLDNYIFNNINTSTDPARNTTPTVSITLSGNIFKSSHTSGQLLLANNVTFSPITGNYQGTYTPVFTAVSNITTVSQSGIAWRYVVSGNVVNIFGSVNVNHAGTAADSRFRVSLPFPYNMTSSSVGGGIMTYTGIGLGDNSTGTGIINTTNNELQFTVSSALAGTTLGYAVSAWYSLNT